MVFTDKEFMSLMYEVRKAVAEADIDGAYWQSVIVDKIREAIVTGSTKYNAVKLVISENASENKWYVEYDSYNSGNEMEISKEVAELLMNLRDSAKEDE